MIDDNPPSQKHNGWHCCELQLQGPRSSAFYCSRNSLLNTWNRYYTEPPIKVPVTHHHLKNRYYAPPQNTITGNYLTLILPPRNKHNHTIRNHLNAVCAHPLTLADIGISKQAHLTPRSTPHSLAKHSLRHYKTPGAPCSHAADYQSHWTVNANSLSIL